MIYFTTQLLKLEDSSFKFLGMHVKQTGDFAVSLGQDTKSIKDLPPGVDSLKEEEKQRVLKSLVSQLLYLDLTRPDLCEGIVWTFLNQANYIDFTDWLSANNSLTQICPTRFRQNESTLA